MMAAFIGASKYDTRFVTEKQLVSSHQSERERNSSRGQERIFRLAAAAER
jgi:hypothetical protein